MSLPMPVINDSSLRIIGESAIARLKLEKANDSQSMNDKYTKDAPNVLHEKRLFPGQYD